MIKKGTVSIVDRYKGSQLIEKVYKGSDLIFDAFSEITGNLPLSFNARAQHVLKNYRVYGAENGAGIDTGNLYNIDAKDTNNGFVEGKYLNRDGSYTDSSNYWVSEYMPVDADVEYTCIMGTFTNPSLCYYDDQKNYISGFSINAKPKFTTAPTGAAFVRISVRKTNAGFTCFVPGHIIDPDYFVPYGYKIPLSISDGTNTSNYDLFIGSTKLGEEEYLDFQEQKVYKDSAGVLIPTDPPTPLPAISAYKGENTLDSTETVGNVTVKGRISETAMLGRPSL